MNVGKTRVTTWRITEVSRQLIPSRCSSDPTGGAYSAPPDSVAGWGRGGMEGVGEEGKGREREGEGDGRGRGAREFVHTGTSFSPIRALTKARHDEVKNITHTE